MKLSVIVPTYNRRAMLERTLPLLLNQDLPAEEYEVIVVVDGSTDGTDEMLKAVETSCRLKRLSAQHRGAGAARNVGIRAAEGDLVLFLDDDILCGPDLLRQHVAAHSGPEPCVVHGPIYTAPDSARSLIRYRIESQYEAFYRRLNPDMALRNPGLDDSTVDVVSELINSSMPRRILLASGGFDEDILAAEDLELGLRLWKMGCVFRWMPSAIVHECYTKTSRQYLSTQAKALAAGLLRTSRKHPEYRSCSSFSSLGEMRWSKRLILNALMRCPVFTLPLIAFPLRFEKWVYPFPSLRQAGVRLLNIAEALTRKRSAAQAAGSWERIHSEFGVRCAALLYHHVGPPRPGMYPGLNVSAKAFERQIRWLARRGYTGILPSHWLRWLRDGTGLPNKPIMITFDDGYADIAEYALPVLRRYGFACAVFVVTKKIGGTNAWDEEQSGTLRLMTAEQIQYWAGQGIEFGAHSRTHRDLCELPETARSAEIAGSKNDLAALLGAPVVSFAYPYSQLDDSVREEVSKQFELAFCGIEGLNSLRGDPHLLRRVSIHPNHSLIEFAFSVWRGKNSSWIDRLRIRVALRTRLKKAYRLLAFGEPH